LAYDKSQAIKYVKRFVVAIVRVFGEEYLARDMSQAIKYVRRFAVAVVQVFGEEYLSAPNA
jgi:hypothetical protein